MHRLWLRTTAPLVWQWLAAARTPLDRVHVPWPTHKFNLCLETERVNK
jgi:hypothetical protein